MSAYLVGLTGGIGSGKSTVADFFVELGATLVDTDRIAHQLTAPGGSAMPALVAAFGSEIATAEGALDRTAMRRRVFADPSARQRLEAILHPLIRRESTRQCAAATTPYAIVAVPLLIESGGWRERCDRVLVVDCPPEMQIDRVVARSGLSKNEAAAILAAQTDRATRLAAADDVIVNDGPVAALAKAVQSLHQTYLRLAEAKKAQANC